MADSPPSSPPPGWSVPDAPPPSMPREIGAYRIQRVIGSGGMATVYAALQSQPRRTVALKVMKGGAASGASLRRFKREVEILGRLHHPYIAQVYDAGTHDDGGGAVPYFVMEYISAARTIIEYAAQQSLSLRDRVKLFVKVCAAVEHGHQHKVIHRDLKPGNILIDEHGDPKVIDFGVAHAAELDVATHTMHTEAGRLIGTLQYMSPEQVDVTPQDIDARADVYALGAVLYRLLTNKLPHALEGLPVYEAVRIIREEDVTPPSHVNPEVRGDLETIILKALGRDRARRYASAGAFGRDLLRYLAHKPIKARPASLAYRAGLFFGRHRQSLIVGGVVIGLLSVALATVWNERARRKALEQTLRDTQAAPVMQSVDALPDGARDVGPLAPVILDGHTARITGLAVSTDGTRLVSASSDHSVRVWSLEERREIGRFADHAAEVSHVALSGDGAWVASASVDGELRLAATADMQHIALQPAGSQRVTSLALSGDGLLLAAGLEDHTIKLWRFEVDDDRVPEPLVLRSASGAFVALAFDDAGGLLAGVTRQGTLHLYEAREGRAMATTAHARMAEARWMAFMPVFRTIVVVSSSGAIVLCAYEPTTGDVGAHDAAAGGSLHVSAVHDANEREMAGAAFVPGAGTIIVAAETRIGILTLTDDAPARRQVTAIEPVVCLAATRDGERLIVGRGTGAIAIVPLREP